MRIHDFGGTPTTETAAPTDPVGMLGGKGAGLIEMAELGLPVPPGFVVPTTACRAYLEHGWTADLEQSIRAGITRLEQVSGRHLGDASAPLLVSVRSGAAVSMPGMMDTALNVGMTPDVARGLGELTGDQGFAVDTYRRAVLSYGEVVSGAPEPVLEAVRTTDADGDIN
ncbi:MAG: PEP/pyruvate-binding domain-containing protein [Acidimicrobiales bacterium]